MCLENLKKKKVILTMLSGFFGFESLKALLAAVYGKTITVLIGANYTLQFTPMLALVFFAMFIIISGLIFWLAYRK